jgi:hypothetical protein
VAIAGKGVRFLGFESDRLAVRFKPIPNHLKKAWRYGATNNIALVGLIAVIHPTAHIINIPIPEVSNRRRRQVPVIVVGRKTVISGEMD